MTAAYIIALAGLLTAITGIVGLFIKVRQIHVLVNSNLSTVMKRVDQLLLALQYAGVKIPPTPNGEQDQ